MQPLLQIENLAIAFKSENGPTVTAVQQLNLAVNRGELLALVGESGSGKSVTSLSVLRLLPQASYPEGRILFSADGETATDLLKLPADRLQTVRGRQIAMIFQEPMTSLNPVMTCGRQVMEALRAHKKLTRDEAQSITLDWFRRVKLPQPEILFHRYPHQLSGGQKQRVMIAMAMCCEPALLICDEPTTALDVTVQKTILDLIRELQQERNMGVIFITHDLGVVSEIADRVAILYKGELVEQNDTASIFGQPRHPYTKALIACRPALHPKGVRLPVVNDFLQGERENIPVKAQTAETRDVEIRGEPLLQVQDLVVRFPGRTTLLGRPKTYFTAVDGVSLEIYRGETLGLVGESGCGKTTLGRTLLHLAEPTSGRILYRGRDITRLSPAEKKALRREAQLVFQDPFSSLNPRLTIETALAEPMAVNGLERTARGRRKRVTELLDRVGLPAASLARYPHEFSGGQRQRIVIARALAVDPQFLVCDESVSALDVSVQAQVLNLLNHLKADLGLTLLFISHDLSVVRYMSDRMLVMQAGKIVEQGDAESIYRQPQHPYTQQLLAAVPSL